MLNIRKDYKVKQFSTFENLNNFMCEVNKEYYEIVSIISHNGMLVVLYRD